MKKRVTWMLEEELVEKFQKFCVEQNGGKFDHGIYSEQLAKAIELLIDSKKPEQELIDLDVLEEVTTSDDIVGEGGLP